MINFYLYTHFYFLSVQQINYHTIVAFLCGCIFVAPTWAVVNNKDAERREASIDTSYGPPATELQLPKAIYGAPAVVTYPAPPPDIPPAPPVPHVEYGVPKEYAVQTSIQVPHNEYGVPPEFAIQQLPHKEYGVPILKYGPPKVHVEYGPPQYINQQQQHHQQHHDSHHHQQQQSSSISFIDQIKQHFGISQPTYGPPHAQYGPPSPAYGPPPQKLKPVYGPPSPQYGPPKPHYGPPKPQYGPPKPQYGPPPKPQYGPPKPSYGPPKPSYGPPKPNYGPPKPHFTSGPPAPQYGPPPKPHQNYGPPAQAFRQPLPNFAPPQAFRPQAPTPLFTSAAQFSSSSIHTGSGAPPTPPEIKCDGWRPIPGPVVQISSIADQQQHQHHHSHDHYNNNDINIVSTSYAINGGKANTDVLIDSNAIDGGLQVPLAEAVDFHNDLGQATGDFNIVQSHAYEVSREF